MNPEESLDRGVSLKNDESNLEYVVFITEIPLRSAYPEMEYGNKLHAAMRLKVIPQRMSIMSGNKVIERSPKVHEQIQHRGRTKETAVRGRITRPGVRQ